MRGTLFFWPIYSYGLPFPYMIYAAASYWQIALKSLLFPRVRLCLILGKKNFHALSLCKYYKLYGKAISLSLKSLSLNHPRKSLIHSMHDTVYSILIINHGAWITEILILYYIAVTKEKLNAKIIRIHLHLDS